MGPANPDPLALKGFDQLHAVVSISKGDSNNHVNLVYSW